MQNLIYLLLRRMRLPLIVVILAYAISILGMVLAPGLDDQGNPWNMNFFHAFYFVSFMGSTIGFGEIPPSCQHLDETRLCGARRKMSVHAWVPEVSVQQQNALP